MNKADFTRPIAIIFGSSGMAFPPVKGRKKFRACTGKISFTIFRGMASGVRMHDCMEKEINGVRYKVHSSYDSDAGFRELYEKCLAARLIRIHEQGCADDAAGN